MIRAEVSTAVHAQAEALVHLVLDVEGWPVLFAATIHGVTVLERSGARTVVDVYHREGRVRNVLTVLAPWELLVEEWKRRYHARFRYLFVEEAGHIRFTLLGEIDLRGWVTLLGPVLGPYIRRSMRENVLEPIRRSAETLSTRSGDVQSAPRSAVT